MSLFRNVILAVQLGLRLIIVSQYSTFLDFASTVFAYQFDRKESRFVGLTNFIQSALLIALVAATAKVFQRASHAHSVSFSGC